jgi:putative transposase
VLSDGTFVENPRAMNRYSKQMARLKKERSRRVRGSKRHRHTQQKIADTHRKVKNLRTDALHQLSAKLSQSYGTVVIEDLNVKGMSASAKGSGNWRGKAALNRAILDVAPAEFRRQLSYKLAWRGGNLIVADRYFPSSKTCSACGRVKAKLALSERRYRCECGLDLDRDLNAARNLASFGARVVAGGRSETENGRRGERLQDSVVAVWCSPVKRQAGTRELDRTGIVGTYAE